jgi:YD repeat-containing protein
VQQPVVTATTFTRLTGLGSGAVSEQVSIDLQGNRTRSTVAVNRTTATETRTTDVPDSSYDAVSVTINGKLMTSANTSGTTTSYDYDGLGRRRRGVAAQAGDAQRGGWQPGWCLCWLPPPRTERAQDPPQRDRSPRHKPHRPEPDT